MCIFAASKIKNICIMVNSVSMQGVYVNVPTADWSLFRELIRKFRMNKPLLNLT